jgi:hypothetical protein
MLAWVKRCALGAEDWLRYHPVVRGALSRYKLLTDHDPRPTDQQAVARSVVRLCSAANLAGSDRAVRAVQRRIRQRVGLLDFRRVGWSEFADHLDGPRVGRGLVMKPPVGDREKGVLFVSFEKEWFKLLLRCDLREFARRYDLVVSPSWSPHSLLNYAFAANYPGTVFSLLCHPSDTDTLPRVAPNVVAVPLYASSWVHPDLFRPLPRGERDIDLIMVANFAKFKRHHALFTALRKMPPGLRVLLIGQDQDGRTADTIRGLARCYAVEGRFALEANVPYSGIPPALCRARASLILSRREGSCVVVAESLFADTPVALLGKAQIGSRAFINAATGRFLAERDLAGQLTDFLARADDYRPRRWAEANISCFESTRRLNEQLRGHALASGQAWTEDVAPLCWRPDPALARPEDAPRMEPARRELKERFGIEVGPWDAN